MRVDQKQTGQWSRTVTATRSGRGPPSAPSAESECCAWITSAVVRGERAREGARHGQALAAGGAQPPDAQAVQVLRSRAGGEDGDLVAGRAQPEGQRARGPARAARARRVDLGGQDDPHAAIRSSTRSSCSQWRAQE